MTDVNGVDPIGNKELRLKRENTQQPVDGTPHGWQPPFSPRPDLGRDQPDYRDTHLFEALRQTEVEIGAIGQDGEVGTRLGGGSQQFAIFAPDARDVGNYLNKSHHGDAGGVDYSADARPLHPRSRAAEELQVRVTAA